MKIARIDVYRFSLPMEPLNISLGTVDEARNILVRIHSDAGLYGIGEGSPLRMIVGETQYTAFATAQNLARLLKGRNPLAIEELVAEMNARVPESPTTRSAFDMALHDLAAKLAGAPLYRFFGGERRRLFTDQTVGIHPPAEMAVAARRLKERGAPAIKVKLGTSPDEDVTRVAAVRKAIGPRIPIRVDANQGWSYEAAVAVLNRISDMGVEYCEQPTRRGEDDELKRVRQSSPVPIMADESVFDHHDASRLASMGACDYFNIKLAKSGGLHTALKVNAIAERAGIRCMVGCMAESRLGLSASAHLAAARPNIAFIDLDSALVHRQDPVRGGIRYGEGLEIILPEAPGLGTDVDEAFLAGLDHVSV